MIDSRQALHLFLAADMRAHGLSEWKPWYRVSKRIVYFQRLLRFSEFYSNVSFGFLSAVPRTYFRIRVKFLGERMGFSIPVNVFGPGLSIAHIGTIVVNMHARIGSNCRIHQGVTIGEANGRYPEIGDRVFIGPNAVIIGCRVGDDSSIWAGAVVTRDVSAGDNVAGAPAKKVKSVGRK